MLLYGLCICTNDNPLAKATSQTGNGALQNKKKVFSQGSIFGPPLFNIISMKYFILSKDQAFIIMQMIILFPVCKGLTYPFLHVDRLCGSHLDMIISITFKTKAMTSDVILSQFRII